MSTEIEKMPNLTQVTLEDVTNWEGLSQIQQIQLIRKYTDKQFLDKTIKQIEAEYSKHTYDSKTEEGRKAIISQAYNVTKSKTLISKIGNELAKELKQSIKPHLTDIKEIQTYSDDKLKALANKIRLPVTTYEKDQQVLEENARKEAAEKEQREQQLIIEQQKLIIEQQSKLIKSNIPDEPPLPATDNSSVKSSKLTQKSVSSSNTSQSPLLNRFSSDEVEYIMQLINNNKIPDIVNINRLSTKIGMDILRKSIKDEDDYAHGWHCNIAMMCYDSIIAKAPEGMNLHSVAHEIGNDAASRFMKLCFDKVTSKDMLNDK